MADDKQTGARAAAEELVQLCEREYPPGFGRTRIAFCATVDKFEAIILTHCPEDKGVEKLVAILKRLDAWGKTGIGISNSMMDILKDTRAALAEYEKVKHD